MKNKAANDPVVTVNVDLVLLSLYCEITGETEPAVRSRIQANKWAQGVHFERVERKIWVYLSAAQNWVKTWTKNNTDESHAA